MNRKTEIKKILSTLSTHTPVDYENLLRTRFPYRIPQNYLQWDELSSYVAYSMAASATMLNSLDQVSNYVKHRTSLWALQEAPLFLLSDDLLQVFEETKIAEDNKFLAALLDQLKIIYPTLILLLPKSKPFRKPVENYRVPFYSGFITIRLNGKTPIRFETNSFPNTFSLLFSWIYAYSLPTLINIQHFYTVLCQQFLPQTFCI